MSCLHLRAWSGQAELGAGQATRAVRPSPSQLVVARRVPIWRAPRAYADRSAQQDVGGTDSHATWPWFATIVPSRSRRANIHGRQCSRCNQHSRQAAACSHHSQSWSRRVQPAKRRRRRGWPPQPPVGLLPRSLTRSSVSPERAVEGFARAAARRAMTGQKRRLSSCGCCRAPGFRIASRGTIRQYGQAPQRALTRRERRQAHEALIPIDSDGGVVAGASDGQHGMFR
jgi:hypothetical protein